MLGLLPPTRALIQYGAIQWLKRRINMQQVIISAQRAAEMGHQPRPHDDSIYDQTFDKEE